MKRLVVLFAVVLLAGCGWFNPLAQITSRQSSQSGPARSSGCALSMSGGGTLAAELPDGALVTGSARRRGSKLVVAVRRVNPDCQSYSLAPVSVPAGKLGTIDAMIATPQAELILAGGDGKHALVGRFLATGRVDTTFGHGRWVRLTPQEKRFSGMPPPAFTATSIAVGPSGSIFAGGNDDGPHCCVQDFVSELTPVGDVARTRILPAFGGSYTTDVSANADGSVYALGQYEGSGCGGPSIIRILRNGSLDERFDKAIARTLKRVAGARSLRFTPTLVPQRGEAFALVGGLDKTCVPQSSQGASSGIAVPVSASGQIAGRVTRFASPNYAFDSPSVLRLSSGRVLAAAFAYTPSGKLKDLLVQTLPGGLRHIPIPDQARTPYPAVRATLLARSADSAWLVIGLPNETDVTPIVVP